MNEIDKKNKVDKLFLDTKSDLYPFSFNESVVEVFPDMINRSVPGYQTIVDGIGRISRHVVKADSRVYDLGCSLGNVSLHIARYNPNIRFTIDAVDNSPAMVERCQQHVDAFNYSADINVSQGDIVELALQSSDLVVINFTLQFIPVQERQAIINKVYESLKPGGILLVSEKVAANTQVIDELLIELHHEFKRDNGYSELEISQKRSALENVMILDTFDEHKKRFIQAGFNDVSVWFQHFNFLSMCAVK